MHTKPSMASQETKLQPITNSDLTKVAGGIARAVCNLGLCRLDLVAQPTNRVDNGL